MATKGYVANVSFICIDDTVYILGNGAASCTMKYFKDYEVPYILENLEEGCDAFDIADIEG